MERTGSKPIDEQIRRAIAGDGTAFTALWDTYISQLRSYVKGWLKQLDDLLVDDICSRSFEKAFRQIGHYDPAKSQFFTWLKTIAHNTALDLIEREGRIHPHNQTVYLDDDIYSGSVSDTLPDEVDSPFILGIFRPEIYVPSGIDENTLELVIASNEHLHCARRYIIF